MQLGSANRHNTQNCCPQSIQNRFCTPNPTLRNRFSPRFRTLYSALRTPYSAPPTYNLNCRMMTKRAKMRAQPAKVTVVVS